MKNAIYKLLLFVFLIPYAGCSQETDISGPTSSEVDSFYLQGDNLVLELSSDSVLTVNVNSLVQAGNVLYVLENPPAQSLGEVGEFAFTPSSQTIYEKRISGVDTTWFTFAETDRQQLSFNNNILAIENGNSVDLSGFAGPEGALIRFITEVPDNSAGQLNEYAIHLQNGFVYQKLLISNTEQWILVGSLDNQLLTLNGTTLGIENGNTFDLGPIIEANQLVQTISKTDQSGVIRIRLSGDGVNETSVLLLDDDPDNEKQELFIQDDSIGLTLSNVKIPLPSGGGSSETLLNTSANVSFPNGAQVDVDGLELQLDQGTHSVSYRLHVTSSTNNPQFQMGLQCPSGCDVSKSVYTFQGNSRQVNGFAFASFASGANYVEIEAKIKVTSSTASVLLTGGNASTATVTLISESFVTAEKLSF